MENKKNIAFITYNRVGDGFHPEVIETKEYNIHIVQMGPNYDKRIDPTLNFDEKLRARNKFAENVVMKAGRLPLNKMDEIFVYIGLVGAEPVVMYTKNIPTKLHYVTCDCNLHKKKELIKEHGHKDADIIPSECSGNETLERILHNYI
jgi:hypothetical protein